MTPKEKAFEIVGKMCLNDCTIENINKVKKYALISVDEIIKLLVDLSEGEWTYIYEVEYYKKVKQEIKKL